jgi:hypothetical protein
MANISLKRLFEAEDFKARSKETGKLVHFKSKDSYQAAIKAGSHEDPKAEKGGASKGVVKPNDMFGADYKKDRGGETPTKLTSILPKDASDGSTIKIGNTSVKIEYVGKNKDYIAYSWEGDDGESNYEEIKVSDHKDMNSLLNRIKDEIRYQRVVVSKRNDTSDGPKVGGEAPNINSKNWKPDEDGKMSFDAADDVRNYLNDVLGVDGMAEVDYNSGNIQYGLADGENSIFVGNDGGTYNVSFEGPSMDLDKIEQSYKSFKNPKEALQYAGELAKANRKGLQQKQESTKLTSMFKK